MVKIYTKSGDAGETSLVGGKRVSKGSQRVSLYGEVDELNSFVGLARANLANDFENCLADISFLESIQRQLFKAGALLACEKVNWPKYNLQSLDKNIVTDVESRIDNLDGKLSELTNFILPGGTVSAASLHTCRSVCRRVEREIVRSDLSVNDEIPDNLIIYLNRLSDYFFVLARYINFVAHVNELNV